MTACVVITVPVKHSYGQLLNDREASEKLEALEDDLKGSKDNDHLKRTASYGHCLHRVRTMSDVALARRVQTIERARGAKAKEKMLVFTHVLRDVDKQDLLRKAEEALNRLVRNTPAPHL